VVGCQIFRMVVFMAWPIGFAAPHSPPYPVPFSSSGYACDGKTLASLRGRGMNGRKQNSTTDLKVYVP